MKDQDPIPCCATNKKAKLVRFRKFAKKTGFYIMIRLTNNPYANGKSYTAVACPFCGKSLDRLNLFL